MGIDSTNKELKYLNWFFLDIPIIIIIKIKIISEENSILKLSCISGQITSNVDPNNINKYPYLLTLSTPNIFTLFLVKLASVLASLISKGIICTETNMNIIKE